MAETLGLFRIEIVLFHQSIQNQFFFFPLTISRLITQPLFQKVHQPQTIQMWIG
jgi:hypothetical protein